MLNKDFDTALKYTLRFEGGLVNDPVDSGGLTNRGVTQKTYNEYHTMTGQPMRSVAHISEAEAEQVYYTLFWHGYKCNEIPYPLNIAVFDFCVNAGANGIKVLQKLVGVKADGVIGAQTLKAIFSKDITKLTSDYLDKRKSYYMGLVLRRPSQVRFIKGWSNRVASLRDLIFH
jgi:lysozyme family protein